MHESTPVILAQKDDERPIILRPTLHGPFFRGQRIWEQWVIDTASVH